MIYDAVQLFAQALHDLDHSQDITTRPLSCDGTETWQHGNSLVNYMKLVCDYIEARLSVVDQVIHFHPQVEMRGLSGRIKFDQHGLRTDFELEIIELKKDGLIQVRK